jgi:choline dehydrogenase-like flavoprotein
VGKAPVAAGASLGTVHCCKHEGRGWFGAHGELARTVVTKSVTADVVIIAAHAIERPGFLLWSGLANKAARSDKI